MPIDAKKIRDLRELRELTQEQAAAAAGIPGGRQAWYDIESGKRLNVKIDTLEAIAGALGVTACDLLTNPNRRRSSK